MYGGSVLKDRWDWELVELGVGRIGDWWVGLGVVNWPDL